MRDHPPCPEEDHLDAIRLAREILPARRARAGAAEPGERHGRAAGRGHRRLGRRVPGHRRLRQPRAPVAVAAAPARGHRGRGQAARPAPGRLPRVHRLGPPGPAVRDDRPRRRRGPRPRRPGRRAPAALRGRGQRRRRRRGQAHRPPLDRLVLRRRRAAPGAPAHRRAARRDQGGARRRAGRPGARPRGDRHALQRPRHGRRRGRPVRRRAAPTDQRRHGHVRPHPQHQLHEPVHLQVQVLRVREGSAQPQPARQAVPAHARGDRRPRPRGVGGGRDRGVPAGRHPPDLRRRLLLAGVQGGPRRGAGDPRPRLHRARGHRRREASARTARGLPAPDEGRGPGLAPGHRRGDPRRPDPRDPVPGQDRHGGVAGGAPDRALASACARTSRSCSAPSSRRCPGRGT